MREEYLLAALRMGAGADPVPEGVSAAARAVFRLRVPGGVPAGPVDLAAPPGARSSPATDASSGTSPGTSPGTDAAAGEPGAAGAGDESWRPGAGDGRDNPAHVRRFSAAGLVIDLETTITGGRMEVAGQVSPAPGPDARIEVRTPHVGKVRALSETGHFAVTGLPPGWVSVVCHRPGRPPVFTRWLRVRP
ncbi:hypothetical protein [Microbispora amethystogenes]|uniref:Carboxypeptidase regulatory-like domain-containing protein n=1 Tax=Microbispora amethystogenes TaxID=1427754 RepID=A0ABQ4FAR0_9ACTN|nr:hypothetical protein [Microbispora amethystogenes]GIH31910.1 hypothetical protein Mam01_20740 [Microbispora amethystogenes]